MFTPYVEAVFHHMWEASKKMDDPSVIAMALAESGLNAEKLMALAQSQPVKDKLFANTERAVERGAFGSPCFFVGDELYFGKDRLGEVEAARLSVTFSGLWGTDHCQSVNDCELV